MATKATTGEWTNSVLVMSEKEPWQATWEVRMAKGEFVGKLLADVPTDYLLALHKAIRAGHYRTKKIERDDDEVWKELEKRGFRYVEQHSAKQPGKFSQEFTWVLVAPQTQPSQ